METHADSSATPRSLAARLHVNQRTLQLALGVIWIFDGLLKFQPHLFRPSFISDVIRPMATGQPTLVASTIDHMANFLSHEATMWVAVFGLVEIGIGVALLFRRTLKPALVMSFIWGIGVALFGEGLGMVLTGDTSPLQGAPGAVCFYVLLGVMVWPKSQADSGALRTGPASSAAGRGIFGGTGSLLVWAAIWVFEAIIWMFPFNRTGNAISNQMDATSVGEPGWYAHFLHAFGQAFTGAGVWVAVILATASIVIALGPLVSRQPQIFIMLGIGLTLAYWVTGEGLGELLTFGGTDPNNGPIVALIGLSVLPLVPARDAEPTPVTRLVTVHPLAAVFSVIAIVLVPMAVAVVPTASLEAAPAHSTQTLTDAPTSSTSATTPSSATSMPGMSMSGSGSGSGATGTSKKTHPSSGSGTHSMNMSAMAGLGVTDAHWKYTGPALPAAEVSELLTVGATTDAGHKMQTPDCSATPTSQQILGATQYIQSTSAAVAKYKNLSAATAAGYIPITNPNYPIVHYINPAYMNTQDLLQPNTVDSLVYATTPYGPVLVAAMYLMPGAGNGPMPYGCLVQWHAHTNLCTNDRTGQIDGFTPCKPGTTHRGSTPMMTHVWQVPVSGGPLAIDPSDLQVVEAAIMAQQQGLAPTTNGVPPSSTPA